jgi:SAM-dependent methyltransferase
MNGAARSNSFHYTVDAVEGALPSARWELCPVRPRAPSWPRGRVVFVRRGARVGRFVTDTADFTDAELAEVTHALGQLYLDVSNKPALDDFARDLVKLARSPVCGGCPEAGRCAGLFEPVAGDAFTPDDARVREVLASLAGTVVDVGCGEGPYGDLFERRAREGALRYVGLDPDARRIEALRARWPWADLRVASAEDPIDLRADHALVLRSWNHLRNPVRAVETFAGMLRPGGTLLVVDNVAFGLVRGRRHALAAERGPAVFEHLRNDDAAAAHARIAAVSPRLRLVERRDVTAATSNQWLLRYEVGP